MLRVLPGVLASATAVALTAVPAAASVAPAPVVDPAPIGPNNFFVGEVNDHSVDATIQMGCFGPITPGETGHPLSGQTVKALPVPPPTSSVVGFTGSAANSIQVLFSPSSSGVTRPVTLTMWAVPAAIPTTLTLPCGGTGTVEFRPLPTSGTARSFFVTVHFASQP